MTFELRFIVEEAWAEVASKISSWGNLRLDGDAMRAKMMIELSHCVELLRALTTNVLLDLMVGFHMIVEVGNLSERSAAVHFDADEWSLARVKSSVIVEICDLSERFTAIVAKMFEC